MNLFAELSLRGAFPLWLTIILVLVASVAAVMLYFRETVKIGLPRKIVLASFRIAAFVLLGFLLLRPTWVSEESKQRPRSVAVLFDNSESMKRKDQRLNLADRLRVAVAFDLRDPTLPLTETDGSSQAIEVPEQTPDKPSRLDVAKAIYRNAQLKLFERLATKGPVQMYLFGQRVRAISDTDLLEAWGASDSRTGVEDAVHEMLQRDENELPTAVVLVTDGNDNASTHTIEDVARECARVNVPLHIYGVGGSSAGLVQLKDFVTSETLFVEDVVQVPVRFRIKGFKEGTVELTLKLGNKQVGETKRVAVREGDDLREVLSFTPTKEDALSNQGRNSLNVSIRVRSANEVLTDELSKQVRVIDRKVKILVVEGAPRWEFKYLQRAFLRDRRVDVSFVMSEGDPRMMRAGPPFLPEFPTTRAELFAFDLVILGDVPMAYIGPEHANWLREFVGEGGGLVMMAGRTHAPADYVGTPIYDMLPVEVAATRFPIDSNKRPSEYHPVVTPAGDRFGMLTLADTPDENKKLWRELPGFYWNCPVTKLKPGAVALLNHPKEKTLDTPPEPMPLWAMHHFGKGMVLFVGTEETWRWRYNESDKYFARFWGQVAYQMGLGHSLGSKQAHLALAQPDSVLGETGQVHARLFNADFRPLTQAKVTGRLERLDAKTGDDRFSLVTLEAVPGQPGDYMAALPHDRVGRYALRVDAAGEPTTMEYRVSLPPDHESAPNSLDEESLRRLAEPSGGKFYREEDLHAMPDAIESRSTPFTERREKLLWNAWMILAFVALLTCEWLGRKFSNLS